MLFLAHFIYLYTNNIYKYLYGQREKAREVTTRDAERASYTEAECVVLTSQGQKGHGARRAARCQAKRLMSFYSRWKGSDRSSSKSSPHSLSLPHARSFPRSMVVDLDCLALVAASRGLHRELTPRARASNHVTCSSAHVPPTPTLPKPP